MVSELELLSLLPADPLEALAALPAEPDAFVLPASPPHPVRMPAVMAATHRSETNFLLFIIPSLSCASIAQNNL